MFARASVIFTLVVSLLFVSQAQLTARAVPTVNAVSGKCDQCTRGCCGDMACCLKSEQKNSSSAPAPSPQQYEVKLATLGLQWPVRLFAAPGKSESFVILEGSSSGHRRSPLAITGILLI
jgi:hypothetical protein